jgi:hypothetical protein
VAQLSTLGGIERIMKTPSLKKLIRAVGFVWLLFACLSLLWCVELVVAAEMKGNSVSQALGDWPIFSLILLAISVYLIAGAPQLVRFIQRHHSDDKKHHAA